ncbi:MAG: AAA family ATPase [Hyphomonadaceae bacterium]|nr:AAA family ATPase [Hyphomonadaceae bacterium]
MPESLQQRVITALGARPGQKADELARALDVSRTEINQLLYGALRDRVRQDNRYRWALIGDQQGGPQAPAAAADDSFPDTNLARLCRYYLACLGFDDAGVSTFLTSNFGDLDYAEVKALPRSAADVPDAAAARQMLGRRRTERGRYGLYFGYPTAVSLIRSRRTNWEGLMVEPILLFPIEQETGTGRLTIDLTFPIINQKPFQAFTSVERDMMMNELVQLEQELGLGADDDRPELDELAMRLRAIRPEWPWKEEIDPAALDAADRLPMTRINAPGIYNRAVIIMAEKSPYTQGLEKELRELANKSERDVAGTVLGRWLSPQAPPAESAGEASEPLIEVLPMNSEQRQAVAAALSRPMTVITGPPGTGKSQVVTNLLVNAAWAGKRVLFASKNNKAVDVVETRVNALGPRPILLRVGAQAYQARLAEYVLALLSATTSVHECEEFEDAKKVHDKLLREGDRLAGEVQTLIATRNQVDKQEQVAEVARERLGEALFQRSPAVDVASAQLAVAEVNQAATRADKTRGGLLTKLFWPFIRSGRFRALAEVVLAQKEAFESSGSFIPTALAVDGDVQSFHDAIAGAYLNLPEIEKAAAYLKALERLRRSRSLEDIGRDEALLQGRIAKNSAALWKLWLRLQPSRLSVQERQNLSRYTALLRMVMEAGEDGQLSRQAYAQYAEMLRQISHLLPCWAVTSLSARGRIPFEPGVFDIIVFDEASQCDIASALPLLYRAKSVVVIGDPKQLSHISGLQRGQDQALLDKHGLMADFPHWAYSHQSLFGLAATQVAGGDVVNLVDHHRSHADIINFSNQEFYEERLRVATSYDRLRRPAQDAPGVRWVDVRGKADKPSGGGAVNARECAAVVQTLRDLVLIKKYEGSVGVVTPFRAQANAITLAVNNDSELAPALIQRGFLADTVHKFQGDERDVMIFSPVLSADTPVGAAAFLRSNGNLFNVAITRARAQLLVVGDLAACGASDVGYLARFARYAASLKDEVRVDVATKTDDLGPQYPNVTRPELVSDWERHFYVAAYRAGLRLIPQYQIEKYVVDFLLSDGDRHLVIEIDGERYHRNWTGELCRRDQIRNQRLFELGYDVTRFWVYEVRDALPSCIQTLKDWREKADVAASQ